LKIKYRQQVVARTVTMTPFLTHAYQVLNEWNQAKAGDPTPWQDIKNGTPYAMPMALSHTSLTPPHSTGISSTSHSSALPSHPSNVPPTNPTITPGPPVTVAMATVPPTAKAGCASTGHATMVPKCQKMSLKEVPEHHLDTEGAMAAPPSGGAKTSPSLQLPVPKQIKWTPVAHDEQLPADKVWNSPTDQLMARCSTCESRSKLTCHMTSTKTVCIECSTSKTKCSFSPFSQAHIDELIATGELPGKSKKAAGKKKINESMAQGKVEKGVRKRKHLHQDSSDSGDEYTPSGTMAKASTSHTSVPLMAHPSTAIAMLTALVASHTMPLMAHPSTAVDTSTAPISPPSGTALLLKANHGPVVKNRCAPTIGGLQREVEDMKCMVKNIADSNQAH